MADRKHSTGLDARLSVRLLAVLLVVIVVPLASCQTPGDKGSTPGAAAGAGPKAPDGAPVADDSKGAKPAEGDKAADAAKGEQPKPPDTLPSPEEAAKGKEPPKGAKPLPKGVGDTVFSDDFAAAKLDPEKWVVVVQNDFETKFEGPDNGRLKLAASTIGTDDKTVKFHGVRTKAPVVDLANGTLISYELDWNKQFNGCYLTTGVWLAPTEQDNPRDDKDHLQFEYIGVPPGKMGRGWVAGKINGMDRRYMTEDWPNQREGRPIGVQKIEMRINKDNLVITENDKVILECNDLGMKFDKAYLYIMMSTHSNYRSRSLFYDNVVVKKLKAE